MALSVGSMLAGRYEITAPIATGGMGEVWRARDRVLDRTVAAKVLRSEYIGDPNFLARFRNEARHTAALSHPNIASVYDYGETEEGGSRLAFLVMEFVEGQPLVSILHDEGRLPVDWTLHVLGQAADGLSAAHRAGVVHRDIKPGNLMVRPDGVVKLTDFGIAQARDATPLTRTGMVVGTAQYLSPEQAQGFEVTAASDVYSLGVVGFECLVGQRPFDGASQVAIALAHINRPPPPLPGDVPPQVRALIERSLAKDPAQRFPDGGAFADAVRAVANGGSIAPVAGVSATGAMTEVMGEVGDDGTRVFSTAAAGAAAAGAATAPRTSEGRPMPPLHGPAVDDDDLAADPRDDDRRRRPAWLWPVVALALLLLLGVGIYLALPDTPTRTASPTPTTVTSTTAAPTNFFLDPSRYIGRDADQVTAELEAAGLVVSRRSADEDQLQEFDRELAPNAVAQVTPSGQVAPGSAVTLYVAEEGFVPGADEEEPQQTQAPAPTEEPEETQAPTPTTTSRPTTTTATTTTTVDPPTTEPTPPEDTAGGASPTDAPATTGTVGPAATNDAGDAGEGITG